MKKIQIHLSGGKKGKEKVKYAAEDNLSQKCDTKLKFGILIDNNKRQTMTVGFFSKIIFRG